MAISTRSRKDTKVQTRDVVLGVQESAALIVTAIEAQNYVNEVTVIEVFIL